MCFPCVFFGEHLRHKLNTNELDLFFNIPWNLWLSLAKVTLNPNDPCFDRKGPCFGGLTFKNRGHWGSRYVDGKEVLFFPKKIPNEILR